MTTSRVSPSLNLGSLDTDSRLVVIAGRVANIDQPFQFFFIEWRGRY
jgi:hypothetical protein